MPTPSHNVLLTSLVAQLSKELFRYSELTLISLERTYVEADTVCFWHISFEVA